MKFVTIREFRNSTAAVRKRLDSEHEMVLAAHRRPFAILTEADKDSFEDGLA